MTCPTVRGKKQASGRPINLLTQHGEGDAKTIPPRRQPSSIPTTSFNQSRARLADCKRKKRARRGRDARPGWRGRRGRRRAALLSCRGSSSPKFPGSLPRPDHPPVRLGAGIPAGPVQLPEPPAPGPQKAALSGHFGKTHWDAKMHMPPGAPTGNVGWAKSPRGKDVHPWIPRSCICPPNSLPPHIPASI